MKALSYLVPESENVSQMGAGVETKHFAQVIKTLLFIALAMLLNCSLLVFGIFITFLYFFRNERVKNVLSLSVSLTIQI